MKTILNKTTRPIKVPLPRGKFLHLGPHKPGEIADRAVDHAPLARLVESGDLEIVGDGSHTDPAKAVTGAVPASTHARQASSSSHRRGDR